MPTNERSVATAARPKKRGHVQSFGDDRVCASPECLTVLSRYNDASKCWRHDAPTASERKRAS